MFAGSNPITAKQTATVLWISKNWIAKRGSIDLVLQYFFIRTIFSSIFMPQHRSNITGAHVVQKLYSQERSKTLPLANDAFPMLQFSIAWQHPSPGLGSAPIKNAGHLLHASLITFPSGSRFILELKKAKRPQLQRTNISCSTRIQKHLGWNGPKNSFEWKTWISYIKMTRYSC